MLVLIFLVCFWLAHDRAAQFFVGFNFPVAVVHDSQSNIALLGLLLLPVKQLLNLAQNLALLRKAVFAYDFVPILT